MRPLLTAAACAVALQLGTAIDAPGQTPFPSPEREIFTRDDLQAAGIQRFVDLIPWIATAAGVVEGLSWIASIDELPPDDLLGGDGPGWSLVIDGQPVHIAAHGALFPELIPTALQQIDSVEVIRTATLVGGRFAERGAVHIHTSAVPDGPSLRGWTRHGAETGDPGPYVFTPKGTPNVERSGPDHVGIVGYGGDGWDIEVSGRRLRTGVSDSLVLDIHGESPFVRSYGKGGTVRLGAEAFGGRHQVMLARHNQIGNSYLPSTGDLEHPSVDQYHAGIGGSLRVGASRIDYRATHGLIASHVGTESHLLSDIARTHASAELRIPRRAWTFAGGIAVDRVRREAVSQTEPTRERTRIDPTLLGTVEYRSVQHREQLLIGVTRVDGRLAEQIAASTRWSLPGDRALGASFSYADPAEESALELSRPSGAPDPQPTPRRIVRGSVGLGQQIGSRLTLEVAAVAGRLTGRSDGAAVDPGEASRGGDSGHYGIHARVVTARTGRVQGRISYRATRHLGGPDEFQGSLRVIPTHQLSGLLAYRLHPSFRLGASLLLKSAADWPAEAYAQDGASELEPISRVDVSVEKWFWSGRLRTQLTVANALGTPERYHPAGADFALRYFIGAALELPAGGSVN